MKADLTLQKIWFYIQSSIKMMESLARLVLEVGNRKGGALLNVVYRIMINSSDKQMRELFTFLLDKAAAPYFQMLKRWIFSGVLEDPFNEFFVKENRFFKKENVEKDLNDKYWDERFTFRADMVPIFLEKQKSRVLQAGKYLNVIRECGRVDVKNPLEDKIDQMGFSFGWLGKVDTDNQQAMDGVDVDMKEENQIDTNPKVANLS